MQNTPDVFEPTAGNRYNLDVFVRITGVPRRSVLVYCRAGLLRPCGNGLNDALEFDDDCVHTLRQIERLRDHHGVNITGVKIILDLMQELEATRRELRFLRGH
ncbi:MAG TPA: chaperone modulator CbpM [Methylomirabilota bacterium]|nr:chaperone modulator CbpM [Methylomirabilota bacterium]